VLSRKSILLTLAAGYSLRLLAGPAETEEPAEAAPPVPTALHATVQDGELIGNELCRRVSMNVGGRRLMLVVPQGFGVDIANSQNVIMVNRDYSCVLSFRIAAPGSVAASSLKADLCRAWLWDRRVKLGEPTSTSKSTSAARLASLRIQHEFSLTAANGSGPAFDLVANVDGVVRNSRVAFIASPVGVLEFNSSSSPEAFEEAKAKLRFVLRGFQISDANGQLEIHPSQSES
jgi:hypothetical protein